ncbi:MAG: TolC family protein, partial [Chitinophagales bacterium]
MKKILSALVIIFYCGIPPVSAQLSLDSCQQKARRNYPAVKQFDLIAKSEEYNVKNASKAYYPQFSVTGIGAYVIQGLPTLPGSETTPEKFQLIGIGQLKQTIWDGGATHAQKEIIRANAGVDSASTDVSLYTLRDRVNQLYFGILLIDEQLKQIDLLKENLQRSLDAANLSL